MLIHIDTCKPASYCTRLAERELFPVSASARHDAYNWNIPVFPVPDIKAAAAAVCTLPVEERRVPGTRKREVVRLTPFTHYTFKL